MRETLVPQPVTMQVPSESKASGYHSVHFCWNGEVYDALGDPSAGDFGTSDTQLVANIVKEAVARADKKEQMPTQAESQTIDNMAQSGSPLAEKVASGLARLYNAEYAFLIIVDATRVLFGRDHWGRRSLMRWDCPDQSQSFQILSTAEDHPKPTETPATSPPSNTFSLEQKTPQDKETGHDESPWKELPPGIVFEISLVTGISSKTPIPKPAVPTTPGPRLPDLLPLAPEGVSDFTWRASFTLEALLSNAVAKRMEHVSRRRPTAVLFSGGLDSAVVAALAAQHCEQSLHLYNVSFGDTFEKSADRKAALVTHQILQEKHPNKNIVFRDIVVRWDDICRHEPHIRTLLQPKTTLMDVNIATALWFASRGRTCDADATAFKDHTTPRVLLLGMGADEQLGGYGRHRKAFERGGMEELASELTMDRERFWERNLGRDDRIESRRPNCLP